MQLEGRTVQVKGPNGELRRTLPEGVAVSRQGETLVITPVSASRTNRMRHGLSRTLVANMVGRGHQGLQQGPGDGGVWATGPRSRAKPWC